MATNVTVLGAAGATVTIPFTSATNAAAAQNALNTISNMVRASFLTQYQYPGSGAVPSPTLIGGVVVSGSAPANLGTLPSGTYSLVSDATNGRPGGAGTTAVSAQNPMTVASGTGGIAIVNMSSNLQMYVAGGTNQVNQGAAGVTAGINVDNGTTGVNAAMGSATITAYNTAQIQVTAGGSGTAAIFARGDNLLTVKGDGSGSAVSVFGGARGLPPGSTPPTHNLTLIGGGNASTYVDVGGDNLMVAPGGGAMTMLGGLDAQGNTMVFGSHGLIDGGFGSNYLATDSLAGATTLIAYGANDTLVGNAGGNSYYVGGVTGTITDNSTLGGATYNTGTGVTASIYGSSGGNNVFNIGAGTVFAQAGHGDGSAGNIFTDVFDGANQITISDFQVGTDVFSLAASNNGGAGISSINYYDDAGTSAFGAVGTQAILTDGTKIDFLDVNVTNSSFIGNPPV